MSPISKIIVGAAATAGLAGIAHGPLGLGGNCCGKIGTAAQAAVGADVTVTMQDNPLQRVALLSGTVADPAARAAALAAALAVPGVASARWVDGGSTAQVAAAPVAQAPATAAAVTSCQSDIDGTLRGKTINFANGRAEVSAASLPLIAVVAKTLKDCPGTAVEVAGHTDRTGSAAANQALSLARARAVVDRIVADGVEADRLTARGYGATQLLDVGLKPVANAANRRIEFRLTQAGAAAAPANSQ